MGSVTDQPTTTAELATAEAAVRRYLQFVADPSSLVDHAAIADLERQAQAADDPIDKLKLLSQLERSRAVDGERTKIDFIRYAKQWADANEISPAAFRALGVDDQLLLAAGIGARQRPATRARRSAAGGDEGASPSGSARAANVTTAQIKLAVSRWTDEFVLADVVAKVGGSPITVRKALDDLVEAGTVVNLGPKQHHDGRGRAPFVYRVR